MGWSPRHNRMKERYNPVMNAAEKEHALFVMEQLCFGCGYHQTVAHHTLLAAPEKRWRRDHRWLLPVCYACHTNIHDNFGDEVAWLASVGRTPEEAIEHMAYLHDARMKYG